jgi:hypothetical protein
MWSTWKQGRKGAKRRREQNKSFPAIACSSESNTTFKLRLGPRARASRIVQRGKARAGAPRHAFFDARLRVPSTSSGLPRRTEVDGCRNAQRASIRQHERVTQGQGKSRAEASVGGIAGRMITNGSEPLLELREQRGQSGVRATGTTRPI